MKRKPKPLTWWCVHDSTGHFLTKPFDTRTEAIKETLRRHHYDWQRARRDGYRCVKLVEVKE